MNVFNFTGNWLEIQNVDFKRFYLCHFKTIKELKPTI